MAVTSPPPKSLPFWKPKKERGLPSDHSLGFSKTVSTKGLLTNKQKASTMYQENQKKKKKEQKWEIPKQSVIHTDCVEMHWLPTTAEQSLRPVSVGRSMAGPSHPAGRSLEQVQCRGSALSPPLFQACRCHRQFCDLERDTRPSNHSLCSCKSYDGLPGLTWLMETN